MGFARHAHFHDKLAWQQCMFEMRRIAGQPEELFDRETALALRAVDPHRGVECDQRDGDIGGCVATQ